MLCYTSCYRFVMRVVIFRQEHGFYNIYLARARGRVVPVQQLEVIYTKKTTIQYCKTNAKKSRKDKKHAEKHQPS